MSGTYEKYTAIGLLINYVLTGKRDVCQRKFDISKSNTLGKLRTIEDVFKLNRSKKYTSSFAGPVPKIHQNLQTVS